MNSLYIAVQLGTHLKPRLKTVCLKERNELGYLDLFSQ